MRKAFALHSRQIKRYSRPGDCPGRLRSFDGQARNTVSRKGFSFDSLKLFLVILFFWMASPVSGHMISRLEVMTDEELGEIRLIRKGGKENADREDKAGCKDRTDKREAEKG